MSNETLTAATFEVKESMFPTETWVHDETILTVAPLWVMNDKVNFDIYKPRIEKNFRENARALGCLPTVSNEALIKCPEVLDKRATVRPHPFNEDGTFNSKLLVPDILADYFIHFDLSKNHCATGSAMCHWCEKKNKIIVDFMHQKLPPQGGEIKLSEARQVVFDLEELGFDFYKVTFDGWQSLDNIQTLQSKGISSCVYSVDRSNEAYDTLIDLINLDLLDYYAHDIFLRELKGLRIINKKYDHQTNGSKDVSDAVAACTFQCNKKRPKTQDEEDKQEEKRGQ